MNSLPTIQRMNNLAAKRAATTQPEPTSQERAELVRQARVNNAKSPALSDHDESLMKPGQTREEFEQIKEANRAAVTEKDGPETTFAQGQRRVNIGNRPSRESDGSPIASPRDAGLRPASIKSQPGLREGSTISAGASQR